MRGIVKPDARQYMKPILICFLLLSTILLSPALMLPSERPQKLVREPHAPIYINGDANFTSENGVIGGNGTPENPYIISGWEIEVPSGNQDWSSGIAIYFTTKHFVISDCVLRSAVANKNRGIYLQCVSNGTIANCTVEGLEYGIYLVEVEKITILENEMLRCYHGISISGDFCYSKNLAIKNNSFKDNVYGISGVGDIYILGNTFYNNTGAGLFCGGITECRENVIENNTDGLICGRGGVIEKNMIRNNTNHGMILGLEKTNCKENEIYGNKIGIGLNLSFSTWDSNSLFAWNKVHDNEIGIMFEYGFLKERSTQESKTMVGVCAISHNEIFDNMQYGIVVTGPVWNVIIFENSIRNSPVGILFGDLIGTSTFIFRNTIENCRDFGIRIENSTTIEGKIFHNIFSSNNVSLHQCYQGCNTSIAWNLSSEGNYWADWVTPDNNYDGIVDIPYRIDGEAGAMDYYPLAYIPQAVPPWPPTELNASAGYGFVHLEWKEPLLSDILNITSYRIYRATEPEDWELIARTSDLNYTDWNVRNGITYYYYVTALNSSGESRKSNIVNATPGDLPGRPENVSATGFEKKIVVHWEEPEETGGCQIIGYKLYRSIFPHWQAEYAILGNVTEYEDWNVEENYTYYYRVSAITRKGEGQSSVVVSATVSTLNLSLLISKEKLSPGESASLKVYVERNATHEPLAFALVVLSFFNLTGSVEKTEGYTGMDGIFATTFIAGSPETEQHGFVSATVVALNYSVVSRSTPMVILAVKKAQEMRLGIDTDTKVRGTWRLRVYVSDSEGKGIENASVFVRLSNGIGVENTTDREGKACFEIGLEDASGLLTAEILANKSGYLNASTKIYIEVEKAGESEESPQVLWVIPASVGLCALVIALIFWKVRRKRKRRF